MALSSADYFGLAGVTSTSGSAFASTLGSGLVGGFISHYF
jgi:hypothetical protein